MTARRRDSRLFLVSLALLSGSGVGFEQHAGGSPGVQTEEHGANLRSEGYRVDTSIPRDGIVPHDQSEPFNERGMAAWEMTMRRDVHYYFFVQVDSEATAKATKTMVSGARGEVWQNNPNNNWTEITRTRLTLLSKHCWMN